MIHGLLRWYRYYVLSKILDKKSETVLDIGCKESVLYEELYKNHYYSLADYDPLSSRVKKEDVQALSFKDNSFDIVVCQQVLEHVPDPIKAIYELKRVAKQQIIISIPNEPIFTLFRCLNWEKEHLWAITPTLLKHHLGKPDTEKFMVMGRYYMASWGVK